MKTFLVFADGDSKSFGSLIVERKEDGVLPQGYHITICIREDYPHLIYRFFQVFFLIHEFGHLLLLKLKIRNSSIHFLLEVLFAFLIKLEGLVSRIA